MDYADVRGAAKRIGRLINDGDEEVIEKMLVIVYFVRVLVASPQEITFLPLKTLQVVSQGTTLRVSRSSRLQPYWVVRLGGASLIFSYLSNPW